MVVVAVVVVIVAVQSSYGDSDIGRAESVRVTKDLQQAMQAYTPCSIKTYSKLCRLTHRAV